MNDTTIRTYDAENNAEIRVYTSPMEFVKDGSAGGRADGRMTGPRSGWTSNRAKSWEQYPQVFPTPNPEGRKLVEEFAAKIDQEIEMPEPVRRRQAWLEEDGEVCLDRALAGDDNIFRGPKRAKRPGTKNVAIVCNATVSCNMNATHVSTVAAGVAAAVDKLEDAGYSVELWVVWSSEDTYDRGGRAFLACRAKECGEPLSYDVLASVCNIDFTRVACHGMTNTGRKPRLGLGQVIPPPPGLFKWIDLTAGIKVVHAAYQTGYNLANPVEQAKRIIREATEA